MKQIILLLTFTFSVFAISAQNIFESKNKGKVTIEKKADTPTPKTSTKDEGKEVDAVIEFDSKVVDYGVIEHNSDGNRKFTFTNTGSEALIIKNAKASCGCTVPDYPKGEIKPGESGEIKVKYATNRVGKFTKTITLTTNASKRPVILTIKGEVNPAPKPANAPEKKAGGAPLEKK